MAEIEAKRGEWHTFGSKRVNMMLGIGSYFNSTKQEALEVAKMRLSRYGLGTKRTLEQVREFTGINLVEKKMEANRCGNLNWVSFEESPEYGVEETLSRSLGARDVDVADAGRQNILTSPKMLRSLSNGGAAIAGAVGGNNSHTMLSEPALNYQIFGGVALASLLIAGISSARRRKKPQRHND
jgi:hypothetical protein